MIAHVRTLVPKIIPHMAVGTRVLQWYKDSSSKDHAVPGMAVGTRCFNAEHLDALGRRLRTLSGF